MKEKAQTITTPVNVSGGIQWNKLEPPKPWRPEEGQEIVGYYLGMSTRKGGYGQYKVVMIAVPKNDGRTTPMMVSGTQVIQALDGSSIKQGAFIRISYVGMKDLDNGHRMKMIDVYEASGAITIEQAQEYLASLEDTAN